MSDIVVDDKDTNENDVQRETFLPTDLVREITSKLPVSSIITYATANQRLRRVILCDEALWRRLRLKHFVESSSTITTNNSEAKSDVVCDERVAGMKGNTVSEWGHEYKRYRETDCADRQYKRSWAHQARLVLASTWHRTLAYDVFIRGSLIFALIFTGVLLGHIFALGSYDPPIHSVEDLLAAILIEICLVGFHLLHEMIATATHSIFMRSRSSWLAAHRTVTVTLVFGVLFGCFIIGLIAVWTSWCLRHARRLRETDNAARWRRLSTT